MTNYFVAEDGYGDVALFSGRTEDDNCQEIARKRVLDQESPVLWPTLINSIVQPEIEAATASRPYRVLTLDEVAKAAEAAYNKFADLSEEESEFGFVDWNSSRTVRQFWCAVTAAALVAADDVRVSEQEAK